MDELQSLLIRAQGVYNAALSSRYLSDANRSCNELERIAEELRNLSHSSRYRNDDKAAGACFDAARSVDIMAQTAHGNKVGKINDMY